MKSDSRIFDKKVFALLKTEYRKIFYANVNKRLMLYPKKSEYTIKGWMLYPKKLIPVFFSDENLDSMEECLIEVLQLQFNQNEKTNTQIRNILNTYKEMPPKRNYLKNTKPQLK